MEVVRRDLRNGFPLRATEMLGIGWALFGWVLGFEGRWRWRRVSCGGMSREGGPVKDPMGFGSYLFGGLRCIGRILFLGEAAGWCAVGVSRWAAAGFCAIVNGMRCGGWWRMGCGESDGGESVERGSCG